MTKVLLEACWYFSQNRGEDCESTVIAIFNNEEEYNKYLEDNDITDKHFNCDLDMGEIPRDSQSTSWLFTQEVIDETM